MSRPLEGIRILDLSRVLAGPWATQLLADLGAEVIKIERPGEGDDTRGWGPPFLTVPNSDVAESAYFLCTNRGKKSVAIDIASPEGAPLVAGLVEKSDVVIENFKVGGLKKYGLDAETLQRFNPRLIYCSITGYGQTGPLSAKPGYDFVIQGSAGLMSVTGSAESGPLKAGVAIVDILTGLYAANAIQAALIERQRTGRGRVIDMALQDVLVAVMANQSLNYLTTGRSPGRLGNVHPNIVPYQAIHAADGMLTVAVGNDSQFRKFCEALDVPALALDERYRTNKARVANREELVERIEAIIATGSATAWLDRFERAGVPCGPVNSMEQVFADEQVVHRGLRIEIPHASLGLVPGVRCPIRFADEATDHGDGPPLLGQHTAAVLGDILGFARDEIASLTERDVVAGR